MNMRGRLAAVLALVVLSACEGGHTSSSPSDGSHEPGDEGGDGTASEYVASGKIVDTQGQPLSGVEVVVDNQFLYDSNEIGQTGTDGRYRIELPTVAATWHTTATHSVEYHRTTYSFPLHPSDDSVFAGNAGAVRNFEWKLKGKRPDDGFYGASVIGYTEPGDFELSLQDVELTLVPDGPIVDGTAGDTVTGKLVSTGDGDALVDVPIGRYTITAKVDGEPLEIRIRNGEGAFESSLTSDFGAPLGDLPIYRIEVELRRL